MQRSSRNGDRSDSNRRIDELLRAAGLADKKFVAVKGFSYRNEKESGIWPVPCSTARKYYCLMNPLTGSGSGQYGGLKSSCSSELSRKKNTTIIMTLSHNLEEVHKVCDTISIMRRGQNIFSDPISKLSESRHYDGARNLQPGKALYGSGVHVSPTPLGNRRR